MKKNDFPICLFKDVLMRRKILWERFYFEFLHYGGCFAAGILVMTSVGLMPIEQMQVGDVARSWDQKTGAFTDSDVTAKTVREVNEVIVLKLDNGRRIITTREHPFWVQNRNAWVPVAEVMPGDLFVTVNGELAEFQGSTSERGPPGEKIAAYNLVVEETSTYFVLPEGSTRKNNAIWVHNACARELLRTALKASPEDEAIRVAMQGHEPRAHHIFPVKEFESFLGKKLQNLGVNLNSAENGVWLPSKKNTRWATLCQCGVTHRETFGRVFCNCSKKIDKFYCLREYKRNGFKSS